MSGKATFCEVGSIKLRKEYETDRQKVNMAQGTREKKPKIFLAK